LGFFFSVSLEYAQFFSQRGHMQVDYVVMNVIGTIIGYLFFVSLKLLCLLSKILKKKKRVYYKEYGYKKKNNTWKYKET